MGANPVPVQIPIGAEEKFEGVIDLIEMKAVRWFDDETMGTNYSLEEIPEDLVELAEEWKEKLVESVAEVDDAYYGTLFRRSGFNYQRRNAMQLFAGQLSKELLFP